MLLPDLPDSSLAADWQYLCERDASDLAQGPAATLEKLNAVRARLLNTNSARMFYIGSADTRQKLERCIPTLLTGFEKTPATEIAYSKTRTIDARVGVRTGNMTKPVYVGLLAPNMPGGVIINSAPLTNYLNTDREHILDYLAAKLYGGGGAHAVFSQTIAAGLAYSNGISSSPDNGSDELLCGANAADTADARVCSQRGEAPDGHAACRLRNCTVFQFSRVGTV